MLEVQDFRDFSITSWYQKFKPLTITTIILELPDEFSNKLRCFERGDDSEEEGDEENCPPAFIDELKNALNILNNSVFIKNNWHAPTDARAFSFGNTLKASSIDDIILFFKTSGILQEDFSSVKGVPFCLTLKQWVNIHPAAEFRCIVINNCLRGITPRDWPTYYPHFKEEGHEIIKTLNKFFTENIKLKFPRTHYVFDIVLSYPETPYIVDFNPLNSKTNLYAFSWKEIGPLLNKETIEEVAPVFRHLDSDIGIMTKASALMKLQQSDD
ncbi:cell division cycle protein 123 homolog [Cylas formicarius]|uniref:cell division cycle protein 123 homolog n=1 Tax=Cylas formicarius TaxID=197179 RepID=UPI002958463F|nr:cell division cycle protein 123 homolog [Cylas formicarius]